MRQRPALLLPSFYSLSLRIRIRISTFTSIHRVEWLQQDLLFTILCSISSVMFIGLAASMGAFLLAGGAKGKRYALPNAEIMIHQPSGGAKGQATEIQIAAENILKTKKRLNEILAANTGKPYETIAADTERDNYMSAQEAAEYGLIDSVITNR